MAHTFCRLLLREVMADVKKHTTKEQRKKAWTFKVISSYEFHGPDGFYWYGQADCAYHAKVKGWEAWMAQEKFDDDNCYNCGECEGCKEVDGS